MRLRCVITEAEKFGEFRTLRLPFTDIYAIPTGAASGRSFPIEGMLVSVRISVVRSGLSLNILRGIYPCVVLALCVAELSDSVFSLRELLLVFQFVALLIVVNSLNTEEIYPPPPGPLFADVLIEVGEVIATGAK